MSRHIRPQLIGAGNPGKCRICGCSELRPCLFKIEPGHPLVACAWIDEERTLCSNPRCVAEIPLRELMAIAQIVMQEGVVQ
jgi:hypothetical protein